MTRKSLVLAAACVAAWAYACDDTVDATKITSSDGGTADGAPSGDQDAGAQSDAPQGDAQQPGNDGSTANDGASTTDGGSDADANVTPAPCSDSDLDAVSADHTDGGAVTISFPNGVSPVQYSPRCVKIKVGQQVSWDGKFENHPLQPYGGDTPNPIPATNVTPGGSGVVTVTFNAAGTFGFHCGNHPTVMNGAVKVVP